MSTSAFGVTHGVSKSMLPDLIAQGSAIATGVKVTHAANKGLLRADKIRSLKSLPGGRAMLRGQKVARKAENAQSKQTFQAMKTRGML